MLGGIRIPGTVLGGRGLGFQPVVLGARRMQPTSHHPSSGLLSSGVQKTPVALPRRSARTPAFSPREKMRNLEVGRCVLFSRQNRGLKLGHRGSENSEKLHQRGQESLPQRPGERTSKMAVD